MCSFSVSALHLALFTSAANITAKCLIGFQTLIFQVLPTTDFSGGRLFRPSRHLKCVHGTTIYSVEPCVMFDIYGTEVICYLIFQTFCFHRRSETKSYAAAPRTILIMHLTWTGICARNGSNLLRHHCLHPFTVQQQDGILTGTWTLVTRAQRPMSGRAESRLTYPADMGHHHQKAEGRKFTGVTSARTQPLMLAIWPCMLGFTRGKNRSNAVCALLHSTGNTSWNCTCALILVRLHSCAVFAPKALSRSLTWRTISKSTISSLPVLLSRKINQHALNHKHHHTGLDGSNGQTEVSIVSKASPKELEGSRLQFGRSRLSHWLLCCL